MRQALYRAYRPKSFDEVVGQQAVTTVLKNEMRAGTPSHAYLFVGSRGTGKTSCAKLVAKAVNCLDLQDGNPCGVCEHCRGVDDGSLLDVEEIDAASNNGVDSIRTLRDEAVFTPAVAAYRVYIIDEVHMLSSSAFNALLKILEEPPKHVIFVLATTEVHKVLPTIISRCQRFDFGRIETGIIAERLLEVSQKEGILLDGEAARLIGRLSDGGMRDALSMLDVCAAQGGEITVDAVRRAAGLAGSEHLLELTGTLAGQDASGALECAARLIAQGLEPQRLCEQMIGHLRALMLVKTMQQPMPLLECPASELEALKDQASSFLLSDILYGLSLLQEAAARMGRSTAKRVELELALVTLCEPSAKTGSAALLKRIERLEAALLKGLPAQPPAVQGGTPPKPDAPQRPEPEKQPPAASKPDAVPADEPAAPAPKAAAAVPFAAWPQVLELLESSNPALAGMLLGTKAYTDEKRVLIDVQNPALLKMLKDNEYTKSGIKKAIAAVTGRQYGLGPYRPPKQEDKSDPLEALISSLPQDDNITIR